MALQDRLTGQGNALTRAEQRTATVLLQETQDVLFMSAAEVAAKANVHESTVIRMAQKLGYDGYAALREDLRQQAQQVDVSARARFRERKSYQLSRLVEDEARALLNMADTIDQDRLDAVAQTLIACRRVFIHGAPILVMSLAKRLRRVGIDVVALPQTGLELPEQLASITKDDILFAFVLREPYPVLAKISKYVERIGADIVVVSDVPGVEFAVQPKHQIIALRGADSTFRTMTVPIVLGYALELAIYHLHQPDAANALDRIGELSTLLGVSNEGSSSIRRAL
jgi:DNA-binding MurR/RpiR family transcriptional regulator